MSHGIRLAGGLTLDPGGSSEILWRDEGVDVAERGIANFIGAGVTVVDDPTNLEVDITIADSLQIAYDGGPAIALGALGAVGISRGALCPDASPALSLTDTNANPGRTAPLLGLGDINNGVGDGIEVLRTVAGAGARGVRVGMPAGERVWSSGVAGAPGTVTAVGFTDGDWCFGSSAMVLTEKVRIVGDARIEGVALLTEQAGDPANLANVGQVYTKEVTARTELFYEDDNANVYQLTGPAAAVTLQNAYDGNPLITLDATGEVNITRGAACPDTEEALVVWDLNANPGRSSHLVWLNDQNVTGFDNASLYISHTTTSTGLAVWLDRNGQAAGAATQRPSGKIRVSASMWDGAAEQARDYEIYAFAPTAADESGTGRSSLAFDYEQQRMLRIRATSAAPGAAAGVIFENDIAVGATVPFAFVATAGDFTTNKIFTIGDTVEAFAVNGNGQIIMPAGTAALPSYSWAGDPDSGLYSVVGDQVGLSLGGSTLDAGLWTYSTSLTTYQRTVNGVTGPELRLFLNKSVNGADSDIGGTITGYGKNIAGATFAEGAIVFSTSNATASIGRISFQTNSGAGLVSVGYFDSNVWRFNASVTGNTAGACTFGNIGAGPVVLTTSSIERARFAVDVATLTSYSATATGQELQLYQDSATPFPGDSVGILSFYGRDTDVTPDKTLYAQIAGEIVSAAEGGECGELNLRVAINGTATDIITASSISAGAIPLLGFFGVGPAARAVSGADLTNLVTAGGVNDQIDDIVIGTTVGADIRNALHQLARKLKQVNDGLRDNGLLT